MNYYVYILFSPSTNKFYKGHTHSLTARLKRHNSGYELATKPGIPWSLIWSIKKQTRSEAVRLEKKLKNLSKNKLIEFVLKYKDNCAGPDALNLVVQWSGC